VPERDRGHVGRCLDDKSVFLQGQVKGQSQALGASHRLKVKVRIRIRVKVKVKDEAHGKGEAPSRGTRLR